MLSAYLKSLTPEELQTLFLRSQGGIAIGIALVFFLLLRSRSPKSGFKLRESDRPKEGSKGEGASRASEPGKKDVPRLEGIRIDGLAHEILGVPESASAGEIQRAYRELMKRYHPDRVGRMGTREWNDAQKIAEAINRAKETMLKALQSQNPKRSGL